MPSKPLRPCSQIGCNELVNGGRCDKHKPTYREYDRYRGSSTERGYNTRWRKYRLVFLMHNPLCVICLKSGEITPATELDHIIPHKGDMDLFWDKGNHQGLCKPCHSRKSVKEDGGWGNKIK